MTVGTGRGQEGTHRAVAAIRRRLAQWPTARVLAAAALAAGLAAMGAQPASAQAHPDMVPVCFYVGGTMEPTHSPNTFIPNGKFYNAKGPAGSVDYQPPSLAARDACTAGEGAAAKCNFGQGTPAFPMCRQMTTAAAAGMPAVVQIPVTLKPEQTSCIAMVRATVDGRIVLTGEFRYEVDDNYVKAESRLKARCADGSCDPISCKRRPISYGAGSSNASNATTANPTTTTTAGSAGLPTGNFEYYWRQIGGNWKSGITPTGVQACNAPGAVCSGDKAGPFNAGETTAYRAGGCGGAPITVQCVVQRAGLASKAPGNPGGGTSGTKPVDPARDKTCRDYAGFSIDADQRTQRAGCSPAGAGPSWQAEYDWCMASPTATVQSRRKAIQGQVDACFKKGTTAGGTGSGAVGGTGSGTGGGPVSTVGLYRPGERVIQKIGPLWELREHIRPDGSFERCSISFLRYPTNMWRFSLLDNRRIVLSIPTHPSAPIGTKLPIRYSAGGKYFSAVAQIDATRTHFDVSQTIGAFARPADADIPIKDRTYRLFLSEIDKALPVLRNCRARFP